MRAVPDPNVIISALLSPTGSPAKVLRAWVDGGFELIVSPALLGELRRALGYTKLQERITLEEAQALIALLRGGAEMHEDPGSPPPVRSRDPGDDYLIALAAEARCLIVTGDKHLLDVDGIPARSPAAFLSLIAR